MGRLRQNRDQVFGNCVLVLILFVLVDIDQVLLLVSHSFSLNDASTNHRKMAIYTTRATKCNSFSIDGGSGSNYSDSNRKHWFGLQRRRRRLDRLRYAGVNIDRRDWISQTIALSSLTMAMFRNNNSIRNQSDQSFIASYKQSQQQQPKLEPSPQVVSSPVCRSNEEEVVSVVLPLERCGGGCNCVRVLIFPSSNDEQQRQSSQRSGLTLQEEAFTPTFRLYRAIVDTGSPYLVIPNEQEDDDDVDDGFSLDPSKYPSTRDVYGTKEGLILWKTSPRIKFSDDRIRVINSSSGKEKLNKEKKKQNQDDYDAGNGSNGRIVMGVLDKTLTAESGGTLLGLVKYNNLNTHKIQIRPTALEQIRLVEQERLAIVQQQSSDQRQNKPVCNDDKQQKNPPIGSKKKQKSDTSTLGDITSFTIDSPNSQLILRSGGKEIPTATATPGKSLLLPSYAAAKFMPLVDLRPLGDFVDHYVCLVDEIVLNNDANTVLRNECTDIYNIEARRKHRPIVAVWDTGLTGCMLTQPFWDEITQLSDNALLTSQTLPSRKSILFPHPSQIHTIDVKIAAAVNNDAAATVPSTKRNGLVSIQASSKINVTNNKNKMKQAMAAATAFSSKLFYVNPITLNWFDDEETAPHIIVLGQAFLVRGALTVDIQNHLISFQSSSL